MITCERDGRQVPASFGDVAAEVRAVRRGIGISDRSHTAVIRVGGAQAWDLLDRVCPCELFLRDAQVRQTLLLDDDGTIAADLSVACEDDGYLVVAEGLPRADVLARLHAARRPPEDVTLELLDVAVIGVDGPFAWELLARFDGPGVIGLPYLSLARMPGGVRCVRAGRTGEFGYELIVPSADAAEVRARLDALGAPLDLTPVGVDALDACALENWFFNAHAEGRLGLTPLHLQLQWRLAWSKDRHPGVAALQALRERGIERRVTGVRGTSLARGTIVTLEEQPIGSVIVPSRDGTFGLAMIDTALAHAGLNAFAAAGSPLRTVSPPFVNNRSLYVKPQRHTWADRARIPFPPDLA